MAYWYLAAFSPSAPASLSPRKSQASFGNNNDNNIGETFHPSYNQAAVLCFKCLITYSAGKSSQPEWPHSWMRSWPEKEENTEHRQKHKCVLITLKCYWTWHPFLKQRPTLCAGSVKGGLSDDCSSSSSLSSSSRVSPLEKWMVLLCLDPAGPPNSVSWVSGDVWQITQVFVLTFSWALYH